MKKLTHEQYEKLIKEFKNNYWKNWEDPEVWVIDILSNLTEKKFPKVELHSGWRDEIITIERNELNDDKEYIEIDSTGGSCSFTNQQFKVFVSECQKIVEWLDKNEKV